MKKIFTGILIMLIAASCASTKTTSTAAVAAPVISPVGQWDYSITGTPQGDFSGVLTVSQADAKYSAVMAGDNADIPFTNFMYNAETKKLSGDFDYSGTPVLFNGDLAGDAINGMMSAGGMDFQFKATRKK